MSEYFMMEPEISEIPRDKICDYCGNEYEGRVSPCLSCGSRLFTWSVPKALPLRTIYKGQKPLPKPLPTHTTGGDDKWDAIFLLGFPLIVLGFLAFVMVFSWWAGI